MISKKLIINDIDYLRILEHFVYIIEHDDELRKHNFLAYITWIEIGPISFEFIKPAAENIMPHIFLQPIFTNDLAIDLKDFCAELMTFKYKINNQGIYFPFDVKTHICYMAHIKWKINQIKSNCVRLVERLNIVSINNQLTYEEAQNLKYKEFYVISNSDEYVFHSWNQRMLNDISPIRERYISLKLKLYVNMLQTFIEDISDISVISDNPYKESFYQKLNYYINKHYETIDFEENEGDIVDNKIYNNDIKHVKDEYDIVSVNYIEFYKELMSLENKMKNVGEYASDDLKHHEYINNIKNKIDQLSPFIIEYEHPETPKYGLDIKIDIGSYVNIIEDFISEFELAIPYKNSRTEYVRNQYWGHSDGFISMDPGLNIMYNIDYKILSARHHTLIIDSMEFHKELQSFQLKLVNKFDKRNYDIDAYNKYIMNLKYKVHYLKKAYSYKIRHYCADDYIRL